MNSERAQSSYYSKWVVFILLLIVLGIAVFSCISGYNLLFPVEGSIELPVSIRARRSADYRVNQDGPQISAVQINIIDQAIQDEQEKESEESSQESTAVVNQTPTLVGPEKTLTAVSNGDQKTATANGGGSQPSETSTTISTSNNTPTSTLTPTSVSQGLFCASPDPESGYVISISPSDGSVGVSIDTNVMIRFSQPMDETTMEGNIDLKPVIKEYEVSYNPITFRTTINPLGELDAETTYEVRVKKNVKNYCGQRQKEDVETEFTTE